MVCFVCLLSVLIVRLLSESVFLASLSEDDEEGPVQTQLCSDDHVTYASCDADQLIVDITNVSTTSEISHCGELAGTILERARHLCLHKSSCSISSSSLGLDCPTPDTCLQMDYICKRRFGIVN